MRVCSNSDAPVIVAGIRLESRGAEAEVDPGKPGVRMLVEAGKIVAVEGAGDSPVSSVSPTADRVAVLERELATVRAELDAERALTRALKVANGGLQGSQKPAQAAQSPDVTESAAAPSDASAEAPEGAANVQEKPSRKKGG